MAARKGICDICGGREYGDIDQHRRTKKHIRNASRAAETNPSSKPDGSVNNGGGIIKTDEGGAVKTESGINTGAASVPEKDTGAGVSASNPTNYGEIKIIKDEPVEKAKSSIDKVLETLFSEELAPVTITIMQGLADRLAPAQNTPEVQSNQFTAEDGSVHERI